MNSATGEPTDFGFDVQLMSQIKRRELRWIWPGVIPRGMPSLIAGKQGLGKSYLICDLAARLSAGLPLPDDTRHPPAKVLLLAREDDPGCVLKPRLAAAGADDNRVYWSVFENTQTLMPMDLTSNIQLLINKCLAESFDLIVIDTFAAFAPVGCDANAAHDVRHFTNALSRLAQATDAGVVTIAHLRKSGTNFGDPMDAIAGSTQMTAAMRVASILEPGAEPGERRLRVVKTNLGRMDELGWKWRFVGGNVNTVPHLEWSRGDGHRAAKPKQERPQLAVATVREALMDIITEGPQTLRKTIDQLRCQLTRGRLVPTREEVHDAILDVIVDGGEDVDLWDGPRGAYMVGLVADRDSIETPEERALRLAQANPQQSVRELRKQACCQMAVASRALKQAKAALETDDNYQPEATA